MMGKIVLCMAFVTKKQSAKDVDYSWGKEKNHKESILSAVCEEPY